MQKLPLTKRFLREDTMLLYLLQKDPVILRFWLYSVSSWRNRAASPCHHSHSVRHTASML